MRPGRDDAITRSALTAVSPTERVPEDVRQCIVDCAQETCTQETCSREFLALRIVGTKSADMWVG